MIKILLWGQIACCCALLQAQERVLSLKEAQGLAAKTPGTVAAPDTGSFLDMTHTAWTRRDGSPGSISSMAQTKDGYLWIGSAFGLYRFDGIHFAAYPFSPQESPLPTQDVASLSADQDGGLWIGLRMTGVVHLHADGTATSYARDSGLQSDTLNRIAVGPDGSVWVIAGNKLLKLVGTQWEIFGQDQGLGRVPVFSLFFDREGTMWVAQDHRLMKLRKGAGTFETAPASVFYVSGMTQTSAGKLWMADSWRTVREIHHTPADAAVTLQGRAELLGDTKGNLWIGEDYYGLTRIRSIDAALDGKRPVEHANSAHWLTSPQIGAMLEDREGNIWVGTALGLDRYQRTLFQHFRTSPLNYYPSMIGAQDGSVWINSHGEPLMRWDEGKITKYGRFVTYGPFANRRNGEVCFVDSRASELQCYGPRSATYVTLDKRIEYAPSIAMVEDTDGSMLISFQGKGIWRYNGSWDKIDAPGLPSVAPWSMLLDSVGRLWLGFQGNQVAVRSGGSFRLLPITAGVWTNTLTLYEGAGTVWAAGANGLSFFDGQHMQLVHSYSDDIFRGTSGIVLDRMGSLWLNSVAGALRISSSQVAHVLHSSDHLTAVEVFDDRDGLTGEPTQFKPTPSAIGDAHGRLWFATAGDVVRFDPQLFAQDSSAPNVLIESVSINGQPLSPVRFKSQTLHAKSTDLHSLEVNYVGMDLSDPERITYRYRLAGEDKGWQEAGSRRQAFYTRLRPGNYTFEVSARKGQGPWSDLRSPLRLEVDPAFYQANWFIALVTLLSLLLIVAIYLLRLRQITHRIRLVMEERANERVKIARELHDTLLQGISGLMLRFHYAAMKTPEGGEVREMLNIALSSADRILVEGRDRVRHLRTTQPPDSDLAAALSIVGEGLKVTDGVNFNVREEGVRRLLRPVVHEEVFSIAREALTNAFRHSQASAVEATIVYGSTDLQVICRDNGHGMDAGVVDRGLAGHWGMLGMRERANHIGATLNITSAPGEGTVISITVQARRAYQRRHRMRAVYSST